MSKSKICVVVLLVLVVLFGISVVGRGCKWLGQAGDVVAQELAPGELLRKYAWFKDCLSQLDKKRADIEIYTARLKTMEDDYTDVARKDWSRTDKEQMSVWQTECAGVKASYNSLAAEYNAQMAKINWRFCNKGNLPKGATEVMPREVARYIER